MAAALSGRCTVQQPSSIVGPEKLKNVTSAMKENVKLPKVQFAVRTGGHAPHANFSNIEHGITLDLGGLNFIRDSTYRRDSVEAEAAFQWGDIYEHLEKTGRSFIHEQSSYWGGGIYPDMTEDAHLYAWVDLKKGDNDLNVYKVAQKSCLASNNMVISAWIEKPETSKGFEVIEPHIPGTDGTIRLDITKSFVLELQGWQSQNQ
ncbi:hypothetical protein HYFRA_00013184 [Hymenoscyphus fraxineus]|uniref:FAD linked oxidase N-terminal domain-containing protein n=1 Tax=Hymenoscyphus fraxineus TaxID=746836 RepID=A0A9N9L9B9_9HELO|nr:hypothetical protein HYFRA_00013184 [Hymenoscyphus fraxineus]